MPANCRERFRDVFAYQSLAKLPQEGNRQLPLNLEQRFSLTFFVTELPGNLVSLFGKSGPKTQFYANSKRMAREALSP